MTAVELAIRRVKQAEELKARRASCKELALEPRDTATCRRRGFGEPIAKFLDEAEGIISIFCELKEGPDD